MSRACTFLLMHFMNSEQTRGEYCRLRADSLVGPYRISFEPSFILLQSIYHNTSTIAKYSEITIGTSLCISSFSFNFVCV